jgi:hypothetical protein
MLKMMLEVIILTNCVSFITVLGTVPIKGMPGGCGLLRDKSTALLAVINETFCIKYFKLLCEAQQSEAELMAGD